MTNNKELSIMMSDGDKKTEFKTSTFDPEHQLAVLDGLFKFFDINVDFEDMINTYNKTGKAYKNFYDNQNQSEFTEVNEPKESLPPISPPAKFREEYETLAKEPLPLDTTEESLDTKPAVYSDIREKDGVKTYKCHYICPKCGKRANRYIEKFSRTVLCHDCRKSMSVISATEEGFPEQDPFGNFFIAGKFKRITTK